MYLGMRSTAVWSVAVVKSALAKAHVTGKRTEYVLSAYTAFSWRLNHPNTPGDIFPKQDYNHIPPSSYSVQQTKDNVVRLAYHIPQDVWSAIIYLPKIYIRSNDKFLTLCIFHLITNGRVYHRKQWANVLNVFQLLP